MVLLGLEFDSLTVGDIEALLDIEQESPSPWSREQLVDELQQSHCWALGVKKAGLLLGYMFGITVVDETEVRKLAVQRRWRQQGLASLLLKKMFQQLQHAGVQTCFLEVRASNQAALRLYVQSGFCEFGLRKSYYTCPTEDAILLHKVMASEEHKRT